jgi:hypothetical protein
VSPPRREKNPTTSELWKIWRLVGMGNQLKVQS